MTHMLFHKMPAMLHAKCFVCVTPVERAQAKPQAALQNTAASSDSKVHSQVMSHAKSWYRQFRHNADHTLLDAGMQVQRYTVKNIAEWQTNCTGPNKQSVHGQANWIVPSSVDKLDDELMQGGGVMPLLCGGFIDKRVATEDCFMQELKRAVLTGSMHDLLCPSCTVQQQD